MVYYKVAFFPLGKIIGASKRMGLAGKAKHSAARLGASSRHSSGRDSCHYRKPVLTDQASARVAKHDEERATRRRVSSSQSKRLTAYALVGSESKKRACLDTLISRLHAREPIKDPAENDPGSPSKDLEQFPFLSRNYSNIQHLGSGAYSTVYKGQSRRTGEWCAIKRLRINEADSRDVNGGLCKPPMYETDVSTWPAFYLLEEEIVMYKCNTLYKRFR